MDVIGPADKSQGDANSLCLFLLFFTPPPAAGSVTKQKKADADE